MARGLTAGLAVAAAIEIADESGLDAVTMAAVAKRCGFTTMSLYRHVANKEELVARMLDTALGAPPPFEGSGWRAGLEAWARDLLAVLREHPWAIDVPITGVLGTQAQLSWLDRGLAALLGTGLDEGQSAEIVLLLNGYVFWMSRLEHSYSKERAEPVIPVAVDLSGLPTLRGAVERGMFEDNSTHDEDFDYGLGVLLDGVATRVRSQ
jgi:AcrR family transcriptional regulator